jgi:DNA-binding response OmpR family regulator
MSAGETRPDAGHFGRFEIVVVERRLRVDGRPVALGSRAFDLLAALVARRDRVVPKDELIEVVWPGLVVEDNNLQVQVSALRKVLGAGAIATVPGRGYQFTLAPTADGTAPSRRAAADVPAGDAPRASRLLVADDNKVNRLLLCRSLELMGHEVAGVDNGRAALERLRGERFDLLLLDLEMPEMDGFGLLERRAADAALREVPVIVTSSLEGAAPVARCIELGADDFLHKPVNPVLLKARVGSSLERKHLRDRERESLARLAPGLPAGTPAERAAAGGRRTEATLLVACLFDVDGLALSQPVPETLELLSSWSTLMLAAIEGHGGRVSQMTGDGLSAVFQTAEVAGRDANAPWAAAQAAFEMAELMALFNAERAASGRAPIGAGLGIASGEVVVGDAGTPRRAVPACVGAAAQRAAGLAALAAGPGASILADAATQAALAGRVVADAVTTITRPGVPVPAYALKKA